MRRITKPLALLLALVMVIGLMPMMALAVDGTEASVAITSTGGWGSDFYEETDAVKLPFGSSGNKVKLWVNEGTASQGINIAAVSIDGGVSASLTKEAVDVADSGAAVTDDGVIEQLSNAGAYAIIDLDALGFGNLSGEHEVVFTYATADGDFKLYVESCGDYAISTASELESDVPIDGSGDQNGEPSNEDNSDETGAPAGNDETPSGSDETPDGNDGMPAENGEALPDNDMALFAAAAFKKVTVTGIPNTGFWDPENHDANLDIPNVYLSGSSTLKFTAANGINLSGISINGITVAFANCKDAITFAQNDDPTKFEGDTAHIAWMDHGGFTINLGQIPAFAGLAEGGYTVSVRYATNNGNGTASLTVESSAGSGETSIAYSDPSGGSTGDEYDENGTVIPIHGVQMDTQYIATFPGGAKWFFDAEGETHSFGTVDADTYRNDLPANSENSKVQNNITLQSSTDGGIFNLHNDTKGNAGVFSIDWESGDYDHQKNIVPVGWGESDGTPQNYEYKSKDEVPSKHRITAAGYTDGAYTIVGWGGDFAGQADKNWLEIKLKDNGDCTLNDALSHLTIYTVGPYGAVYDKVYLNNIEFGGDTDNLKFKSGPDSNGYYTYEAHLRGSKYAQGIKFAFDRTSESNSRHSGTLLIEQVRVNMYGDKNDSQWQDFGPFAYDKNKDNYEEDPTDSAYLPFIRSKINNNGTAENAESGANRERGTGWLRWTMSTSDANIVNNVTSNTDALQIKYRNDSEEHLATHTTFTELDGTKDLNANWLVVTMGTAGYDESVMNMKVQLIDRFGNITAIPLSGFAKSMEPDAEKIDAEYINGVYRTIYYDLTQLQGFSGFRNIRFRFEGVANNLGSGSRDSRYLYLTQVYLIGENATVYKEVDKTVAQAGEELTYTITAWNNGTVNLSSYTVNDVLPSDVEFKSITCNDSEFTSYTLAGSALTLNGSNLNAGDSHVYKVTVTVKSGVSNGTVLENTARITKLGSKDVSIVSNTVSTVVASNEYIFYAEVGQKTTLPINLGQSFETVRKEEEVAQEYKITVPSSKTATITGVSIPAGAEVRLSGPTDGAFKMAAQNSIVVGDKGYALVRSDGTLSGFKSNKDLIYVDESDGDNGTDKNGPLSSFVEGSYVTLLDAPTGDNLSVTINLGQMWADTRTFTLSVVTKQTVDGRGDLKPNTFASIQTQPTKATIEDAAGMVGKNDCNLLYTSAETGADTFELTYYPGGDTTKTQTAKVTVYNYRVDDQIYVLDYGLGVNLTDGKSGFLQNATLSLEGDNAGYAFAGLSEARRNTDNVADTGDYATPYGAASLECSNGRADWNGMPDLESLSVTFTPTTFMSSIDTFYYGVQVSRNDTTPSDATNATPVMEGEIKVMPANVVYYEDNFSHSGTDSADGTNGIIYTGAKSLGDEKDTFQWQTNDQDSAYGYDEEAYKGAIESFSNGNAHELSIKGTASFTFKGTGFDIIGRTNDSTGIIGALIYSVDEAGNATFDKFVVVDTYYENGDLYQIPVISVLNLAYGTHKVDLYSMRGYADEYAGKTSTVYIDGVRIYNPLGEEGDPAYGEEQGAAFKEIKSMIFGSNFSYNRNEPQNSTWTGGEPAEVMATLVKFDVAKNAYLNGSTLVEILKNRNNADEPVEAAPGSTYDLLTYAFSGPNKELYLADGYGIGFEPWLVDETEDATLQIGVKLISKPANTYPRIQYLNSDGGWDTLCVVNSSTEKYYSLEEIVAGGNIYAETLTLRVDGPGIVSLTNIKSKGYEFYPVATEADKNYDPTQMIVLKQEDLNVISGYRNGKFAASLINIRVTTAVADDIAAVKVFDMDDNEIVLQSMTFKDNGEIRTWTIKFKAKVAAENYRIQVFNSSGNFSNQVNVMGRAVQQ